MRRRSPRPRRTPRSSHLGRREAEHEQHARAGRRPGHVGGHDRDRPAEVVQQIQRQREVPIRPGMERLHQLVGRQSRETGGSGTQRCYQNARSQLMKRRDFGPYMPCTPEYPGPQLGYSFGVSTHSLRGGGPRRRVDRIARRRFAEEVARKHAVDPGDVEHVLSNLTLPPLERLQRSLRRARLGRPASK